MMSASVQAAEWSVTPEVRETVLFDDNRRLTTADHESVWGNELTAGGRGRYRTELTEISITPKFRQRRFSNEKEILDRDDFLFDADLEHTGERSRLELGLSLDYRGSLTTDLESSTRTNVNVDARDRALSGSWSYALDARNSVQVAGSYSDIDYENSTTTGLSGYRFASVSVTGIRSLTERDQVSLTVFNSRYTQPRNITVSNNVATTQESETDTVGFQLGYSRSFTENLLGSVSLGTRNSDSESQTSQAFDVTTPIGVGGQRVSAAAANNKVDITGDPLRVPAGSTFLLGGLFPVVAGDGADFTAAPGTVLLVPPGTGVLLSDVDESSSGLAINASIEQALETLDWSVSYSRSLSPQADGDLNERDDLQVRLRQEFSQRLSGTLDGRYYEDGAVGDSGQNERKFFRLAAGLNWRLDRNWTLGGRYQFRRNENSVGDAAESNAVFITLTYLRDTLAWSR